MLLNCGVGEDSWESLGRQRDQTSQSQRKSVLSIHWKDWCWSWNSRTLATWCEKLTHLKTPWCWERLKAGGEGDDRGWDAWMASPTWGTLVWASFRSWWWTGNPGMLQSMGVTKSDTTEWLNWRASLQPDQWGYKVSASRWYSAGHSQGRLEPGRCPKEDWQQEESAC